MSLSELNFLELYIDLDGLVPARMRPIYDDTTKQTLVFVPVDYLTLIDRLIEEISGTDKRSWSTTIDDIRVIIRKYTTASGERWASIKRAPHRVPRMEELHFPTSIKNRLKFFARNTGLILFTGEYGHGKTTSANATLEYYLRLYGGNAITVENPIVFDYSDFSPATSSANCTQYEVNSDSDWVKHLSFADKIDARYVFLDEMITPEASVKALELARTRLVVSTISGSSIEQAIERLRLRVEPILRKNSSQVIAETLLSVVHQDLQPGSFNMEILYAEGKGLGDPVRSIINKEQDALLQQIIKLQNKE